MRLTMSCTNRTIEEEEESEAPRRDGHGLRAVGWPDHQRETTGYRPSRFRDTVASTRGFATRLTANGRLNVRFITVSTLLLTFGITTTNCSQILSGREYTIGGRVGEDAVLPCDVNVTMCGRVYLITWTKNTSTEWKRVYLYSDSYETPMGQLTDPEKASFYLEKNAAYLRIKSLSIEDEGAYKCDVTYVHGKCPSLSFVQLHAFIVPSEPIVEVESEVALNGTEVGPFVEGSPLTLNCKSRGGRPPPKVTWFNGTQSMVSKTRMKAEPDGTYDVISQVRFVLTRWDLGAKLVCAVVTNATKAPQEKWIKLDVHVRPHSLLVRSPQAHVVAGEMVSLTCTVNGARPAANITWYNRSDIVRPQPPSSKDLMSEGTYRTSSTLVFTALRYDHQGEFFCKGTNEVLKKRQEAPLLTAAKLHVLYPPAVAVSPEGKLSIPEREAANITCTFDANPPNVTDILWYKNGEIHKTRRKGDSKTRRPLATVLRLRNVSREDSGSYSCEARNAFGRDNSSNALLLDVMYVPIVVLKLDRNSIVEGSKTNITMSCEVLAGNPNQLKTVRWYQNETLIRETSTAYFVLTAVDRSFSSIYSCEGQNEAGWSERSESRPVQIQYPPGPAIIQQLEAEAVKGKAVTLRCLVEDAGFPYPSHFLWQHGGVSLQTNGSFESLAIDPVTVSSQGNYTCSAVNDVGGGAKGFFFLAAKAPPNFVESLPERGGALRNATSVSLVCRVECEPPCDIQWYRNNESLAESRIFSSSIQLVAEDPDENLFRSVMSTLNWNMALAQTETFHNSVFACRSTGNGVGPGVSSSTLFTIEYPPEDVELSAVKIELVEGELVEDLRCSASANPGGDYHWLLGERLVHSGPILSFNSSVSRDMGGRYTCVVSNRHGRAQADVDVTVLHRPECFLWRDFDHKGNVMLTCSAKGNPGVSRFMWYRNNSVLQEVVAVSYSAEGSSSTYSLPADTPDMYGKYACVAVNAIGNSDSCELELAPLPSPAGWVQLFLQEENLIIVACVAGGIAVLGIILVTVIIILVIRRRFSGPPKSEVDDHEKSPQYGSRRHLEPNLFSPESETEREPFARRICDFHNDLGHHNHLDEPETLKKQIYPENGVG